MREEERFERKRGREGGREERKTEEGERKTPVTPLHQGRKNRMEGEEGRMRGEGEMLNTMRTCTCT